MIIQQNTGNLLEAKVEALVNAVNCVGMMGKGIALQFKNSFPDNFKAYEKGCKNNDVIPGQVFIFDTGNDIPKYIINFPTKRHWKDKSQLIDIKTGLNHLKKEIIKLSIKSIAIPPLGCGLGGLDWEEVKPLIENTFIDLPDVKVLLFLPR